MRQIGILFFLGQFKNLLSFHRQQTMRRLSLTGFEVLQSEAVSGLALPPVNSSPIGSQASATSSHRNSLHLGRFNHIENLVFLPTAYPLTGYRSHEPPFVFFRNITNSTERSARARSFSSRSRFRVSYSSAATGGRFLPGLAARRSKAACLTCCRMRT